MKKKPKITPENKAILEAPENKRQLGALSPWDQRLVGAEAKTPPAKKQAKKKTAKKR
jgi:hypothetical protein